MLSKQKIAVSSIQVFPTLPERNIPSSHRVEKIMMQPFELITFCLERRKSDSKKRY